MDKYIRIRPEKINSYTFKDVMTFYWVFIIPIVIGVFFAIELREYSPLIAFVLIFGIIFLIAYFIKREYIKTYRYYIGQNGTGLKFDMEQTSMLIKLFLEFAHARNKRRFGINEGRYLNYNDIGSVKILKNKIVVQAKDNNMLTNNGKMTFPCEIEKFEEIKLFFGQLQKKEKGAITNHQL